MLDYLAMKYDVIFGIAFTVIVIAAIYVPQAGVMKQRLAGKKKLDEDDEMVFVTVGTEMFPIQREFLSSWNKFNKNQQFQWIQNLKKKLKDGQITAVGVDGKTMYVATELGKSITYHQEKYYMDKKYQKDVR